MSMIELYPFNTVEGFDVEKYIQKETAEDGTTTVYMPVAARKLWFRMKHPTGVIRKRIIEMTADYAVVEARVYLDVKDPDESYAAIGYGSQYRSEVDFGVHYLETAETKATGRALSDAGFNLAFAVEDGDSIENPAETPKRVGTTVGTAETMPAPLTSETPLEPEYRKEAPSPAPVTESSSVEDIMKAITLHDAMEYIIPNGLAMGKPMKTLQPKQIAWYASEYAGHNNMLRASAKMIMEASKVS